MSSEPSTARHSPVPSNASASVTEATSMSSTTEPITDKETLAKSEKPPDDTSKLKTFLGILRRFIGVSDIAAVRFSLPAQLMEPIPNLEYWNYMDRPDTFISIGDSDDDLGRMFEVLRFWFTKDLKYVKGKPCKPYNSSLGEFFRCSWEAKDTWPTINGTGRKKSIVDDSDTKDKPVRLSYLTEQTSHHPPVSAFVVQCPEKGITARGFDQISAKFTGTSIRVSPGQHNLGIFIELARRAGEEYHLTHPTATLGGLLRGSLSVTVADTCFVTCKQTKMKAILHYMEEGWLGRTQNKVTGVVFRFDPDNDTVTRIKDVPKEALLGKVEGNWTDKLYYSLGEDGEKTLLIDLGPLEQATKIVPPESAQLPNESRRFWHDVTAAIHARQYGLATKTKQELEERQRQRAAERDKTGQTWHPRFFTQALEKGGRPELSTDGKKALAGLERSEYALEEQEQ